MGALEIYLTLRNILKLIYHFRWSPIEINGNELSFSDPNQNENEIYETSMITNQVGNFQRFSSINFYGYL